MGISTQLERFYASQMPTPSLVDKAVEAGDGSLIALAHIHIMDVPRKGIWAPDELMSHITGFRVVRPIADNRNPNVFTSLGRGPNARYAIASYSCEDAVLAAAEASKLKSLDIMRDAVPLNLIRRHMRHYNIEMPAKQRTVAWIL